MTPSCLGVHLLLTFALRRGRPPRADERVPFRWNRKFTRVAVADTTVVRVLPRAVAATSMPCLVPGLNRDYSSRRAMIKIQIFMINDNDRRRDSPVQVFESASVLQPFLYTTRQTTETLP